MKLYPAYERNGASPGSGSHGLSARVVTSQIAMAQAPTLALLRVAVTKSLRLALSGAFAVSRRLVKGVRWRCRGVNDVERHSDYGESVSATENFAQRTHMNLLNSMELAAVRSVDRYGP